MMAAPRATATTIAGHDGRFHFDVLPGRYAVTATAAGYRTMSSIDASVSDADVTLGGNGAFTVTGTVRVSGTSVPAGTKICASRYSRDEGDLWVQFHS